LVSVKHRKANARYQIKPDPGGGLSFFKISFPQSLIRNKHSGVMFVTCCVVLRQTALRFEYLSKFCCRVFS
jgi:hypothetical protein